MASDKVLLRAACVLRSGSDYTSDHVGRLKAALDRHLTGVPLICLSDVEVPCKRRPLRYRWPGWWSKMELMRPDIRGDLLYFDLDTVIVGDISEFAKVRRLMMLRDFYHPERPQSALMYLPEAARRMAWQQWMQGPDQHMSACGVYGDQMFLDQCWGERVLHWQDILPGQAVSYKVHVRPLGDVPEGARVVCFHGFPRPWAVGWLGQ